LKFGLYGINVGPCCEPDALARIAVRAEEAGFDSLWTAEHVVLPDPQAPPSPAPPHMKLLDPAVALGFAAAVTTRVKLATGIVILPQRNPVVAAKTFASVDRLSGGRLIFGVAAGYLHQEFAAIGAPFAERGRRTDEYIEAIRSLWCDERPVFDGRFTRFGSIQQQPPPIQSPHPPIVVGGMSDAALSRAARLGDGWYGFALDVEATRGCLEKLRNMPGYSDRTDFEISISPLGLPSPDLIRQYEELGVDRIVITPFARGEDDLVRTIDEVKDSLIDR
jgi:probable F420-dependent oxidoreductase